MTKQHDEALAWFARLGHRSITAAERREFAAWRRYPANEAAFAAVQAERARFNRYTVRPTVHGFSVYDVWTGQAVVVGLEPMDGLAAKDAETAAELLNRRVRQGDRRVMQ